MSTENAITKKQARECEKEFIACIKDGEAYDNVYPLTIVADRYCGVYSGAAFTAWNKDPNELPDDIAGGDRSCASFWRDADRNEMGFGDTPGEAYEDLCARLGKRARKSKIKYWIYEFDMPEETAKGVDRLLAECEMTLDEFFTAAVENTLSDPECAKKAYREMETHPENNLKISLVRAYPVYRDETEAQAKRRKLAEEIQDAQTAT